MFPFIRHLLLAAACPPKEEKQQFFKQYRQIIALATK